MKNSIVFSNMFSLPLKYINSLPHIAPVLYIFVQKMYNEGKRSLNPKIGLFSVLMKNKDLFKKNLLKISHSLESFIFLIN